MNNAINETTSEIIYQYILAKENTDWEIKQLLPSLYMEKHSNNLLRTLYSSFVLNTNIPVSLPIFSLFGYIANHLNKNNVCWTIPDTIEKQKANLWIINLAPSGASKTFSLSILDKAMPKNEHGVSIVERNFDEISGPKALVKEFQEKNGGFWFMDECAQVLKQIEQIGSPMSECKKILLEAFDGGKIQRKNSSEHIVVENASVTMLWLNTIDSFVNNLSFESLSDGFAQRFLYVITERDLNRKAGNYALYNSSELIKNLEGEMVEVFVNTTLHQEYLIQDNVVNMYKKAFKSIFEDEFKSSLDESFYRRVMFKAFTYSIIYHLILKKNTNEIDCEDMEFALRVCSVHLHSVNRLLQLKYQDEDGVQKMKKICEKILKRMDEGKSCTSRDIQRNIYGIKDSKEAEMYLSLIKKAMSNKSPNIQYFNQQ